MNFVETGIKIKLSDDIFKEKFENRIFIIRRPLNHYINMQYIKYKGNISKFCKIDFSKNI